MKQIQISNPNVMFNVELRAFLKGQLRVVKVPLKEFAGAKNDNHILDLIFKYGQNDFQPQEVPSVSMGDVIRFAGNRYLILDVGFRKLKQGQFTTRRPKLKSLLTLTKKKAKQWTQLNQETKQQ